MKNKDFLLKMPPQWHEMIANISRTSGLPMSDVMRNALRENLNLPEIALNPTYRGSAIVKNSKKSRLTTTATRVTLSIDLPRYMDVVLKSTAKHQNWSISSLVCMILYKSIKGLPSKPDISKYSDTMMRHTPLEDAPETYHLRASVPADWADTLKEYAGLSNQKLGQALGVLLESKLGMLKDSALATYEQERLAKQAENDAYYEKLNQAQQSSA